MIFKFLQSLGHPVADGVQQFYKNVDLWEAWWKGETKWHSYYIRSGRDTPIKAKHKSLRMAKRVSEDWANLLLNDKTYINCDDEAAQTFLTGDDQEQNAGVLGDSRFWMLGNRLIEKAFATGTAAFYLQLEDAVADQSGNVTAQTVRIKYITDSRMIVPLAWEDGVIHDLALASKSRHDGKDYIYIQLFLRDGSGYRVENRYAIINDGGFTEVDPGDFGVVPSYTMPIKPFFLVMPNIENNVQSGVPLGISVYANSIDELEGCDLAYDNFFHDIRLGRKRVYMSQAAIAMEMAYVQTKTGEDRAVRQPNREATIDNDLYVVTGDKLPSEAQFFQEYNPDLRAADNEKNVQVALNLLSSSVGLGKSRYKFDMSGANTATEIKLANKDLTESIWRQRIAIQETLEDMARAILVLGADVCKVPLDKDTKISIQFLDTMFADEEQERLRFLQEIAAGVKQKWEYRVRFEGESEETARQMTNETGLQEPYNPPGDD